MPKRIIQRHHELYGWRMNANCKLCGAVRDKRNKYGLCRKCYDKNMPFQVKEKISLAHFGKILRPFTLEHRRKIGNAQKGNKNHNWKNGKSYGHSKRLIVQIRRCIEYANWKHKILKRDFKEYPNIPKKIQVHHLEPLSNLLHKYKITTIDEAINCKYLWNIQIGISLKKGEHYIITLLERMKHPTLGFVNNLKYLIAKWELDGRIGG